MNTVEPNGASATVGAERAHAVQTTWTKPTTGPPLLSVRGLVKRFETRSKGFTRRVVGHVAAVDGVSFDVGPGETFALVGESGSGKSTTARCVLRLVEPTSGSIMYDGRDVTALGREPLRALRREMQIVFQDPHASLDPRMTVGALIAEPMTVHGVSTAEARTRVTELLDQVGLDPEHAHRYPHEFSGGQLQRVGIARALSLRPRLLVLDEPVSALDVSIQAGVLNLLARLQRDLGISYLIIAHDLAVVRHVAHRVAVMNLGVIVEEGLTEQLFAAPSHPYTQALLSAVPLPDPLAEEARRADRRTLQGDPPDPSAPPGGCVFAPRCWRAEAACDERPHLLAHPEVPGTTLAACHFPGPEVTARAR